MGIPFLLLLPLNIANCRIYANVFDSKYRLKELKRITGSRVENIVSTELLGKKQKAHEF